MIVHALALNAPVVQTDAKTGNLPIALTFVPE
jgi:hypothetical protein